jgi:hypothetical protein
MKHKPFTSPVPSPGFIIPAEVHSDDYAAQAHFDALPWFQSATDEEIAALAAIGWRGDYAADHVSQDLPGENDEVRAVFDYVCTARRVRDIGHETSVDGAAALQWVKANRPAAFVQIEREGNAD